MTTERQTITSLLSDCAARGDETALAYRRGVRTVRWSYARLAAASYRTARELEARGIGRGDRVIVWAENSAEWVAAFFGCCLRGAIVVPLDAASAPDFAARVESQINAKLLLYGDVEAGGLARRVPSLRLAELSRAVSRHPSGVYEAGAISSDDIAEIIYTSGTTAEPKGVVLTHANLLASLAPIERGARKYLKWERLFHPIRFLSLVPLSHVFGQFMGVFVPQVIGGEVFFQDSLKPSEIVETVKRERVSVVVAVPRLLDTLRERIEREEEARGRLAQFRRKLEEARGWSTARRWWEFRDVHRLLGWKFWAFVVGGATLAAETETFWRRLGYAVVQGYGMTETASLVTVNHPFKQSHGSIGASLPGQEIRIGEGGEIMVRGANVSPGYWDGEGVRAAGDSEGWLRTGDVAERDAAGRLYFRGRKKDVLVTAAGLNIYPEDLEAALERQTEVRAAAVVGVGDARGGDEPVAVLVLRDEAANVADIVRRANESLARHQQIRRWLVWGEPDLPRTHTQKIVRREVARVVRERLAAGSGTREARDTSAGNGRAARAALTEHETHAAHDALAELVARVSPEAAALRLTPETDLTTDLKLDSLARVELLGALEDRFQVEIDEAAFAAAATLGDVRRLVREGAGVAHGDDASRDASRPDAAGSDGARSRNALRLTTRGDVARDETSRAVGTQVERSDDEESSVERERGLVGEARGRLARYPFPRWALRFPATWIRVVLLYAVAFPVVRVLCPLRVKGRGRVAGLGARPVLFVANHVTYFDHALLMDAMPGRRARHLAIAMEGERLRDWRHAPRGTSLFARLLGLAQYALVTLIFNTFPLPHRSGFRRSFAYAGEAADRGFDLLVFPEGRRTPDGSLGAFLAGTGLLVKELGVPVVPARIDGLSELKRAGRRVIALPGEVSVTFGEPVEFTDEDPTEIARELRRRVAAL